MARKEPVLDALITNANILPFTMRNERWCGLCSYREFLQKQKIVPFLWHLLSRLQQIPSTRSIHSKSSYECAKMLQNNCFKPEEMKEMAGHIYSDEVINEREVKKKRRG